MAWFIQTHWNVIEYNCIYFLFTQQTVLFLQVYDGIMKNISEQSPLKQKLFHYALGVSRQRNEKLEFQKPVGAFLNFQANLFDKILFSKIRAKLGGNLS